MSDIKLIKDLKMKEIEIICKSVKECAKCPLLISSYQREIHCIRNEDVKIYDVEKTYKILNTGINLNEFKEG